MGAFLVWNIESLTPPVLTFDVVTNENPNFPTQIAEHVVEKGADISDNVRVGQKTLTLEVFVSNEPTDPNAQYGKGTGKVQSIGGIDIPGALGQPFLIPGTPVLTQATWFTLPIGIPILNSLTAHEVDVPFIPNVGLKPLGQGSVNPNVLTFATTFDAVASTHDQLDALRMDATLITVYGTKGVYSNMVIESFSMTRDATTGTGGKFTIELKEIRIVQTQTVAAPNPTKPRAQSPTNKGSQATTPVTNQSVKSTAKLILDTLTGGSISLPTP